MIIKLEHEFNLSKQSEGSLEVENDFTDGFSPSHQNQSKFKNVRSPKRGLHKITPSTGLITNKKAQMQLPDQHQVQSPKGNNFSKRKSQTPIMQRPNYNIQAQLSPQSYQYYFILPFSHMIL